MPRGRGILCGTDTPENVWRKMYGTDNYGNLPDYKYLYHEGQCWMPCPYSTQATALRTRLLLGLADVDPLPTKDDHTGSDGRVYYMKAWGKGPRWGYECTFDGCFFYTTNNERYFYV
jgi:hypothetical protein